ncbi:MAG: AAA family ATPase, partial [Bacteroidetes bacterium]|nr:AAA family ATPase [Bacteroidota bacterium]
MITSLTIRELATYDDKTPALDDLRKINFFFGLNGSGKSTISKYLYNLSIDNVNENTKYSKCSHEGYDSSKENILVYDDEFIKRNFIEKDTLKGIFSLNEKNKEIDEKIEAKKLEIDISNNYIKTLNNRSVFLEDTKLYKDKDIYNICFSQRDMFKTYPKLNLPYKGVKKKNFENILKYISFEEKDKKDESYFNTKYNELYE